MRLALSLIILNFSIILAHASTKALSNSGVESSKSSSDLPARKMKKKANSTLSNQLDPSLTSAERSGFSGRISLDAYTDFKELDDETKNYYSQTIINTNYNLSSGDAIGLMLPMQKELSGEYNQGFFLDALISYSKNNLFSNEYMLFNLRGGVLYPSTDNSKLRDEMTVGFQVDPIMIFKLSSITPGLNFIYIPRYQRRFHRFTTNREGSSIVNNALLQVFVISYGYEKWDFSSTLLYVSRSRYDGARTDDSYLTAQEIGYSINPQIRLRVGLLQGGNIIEQQYGADSNIEVFDRNTTDFYTGVAYTF